MKKYPEKYPGSRLSQQFQFFKLYKVEYRKDFDRRDFVILNVAMVLTKELEMMVLK